MTQRRASLNLDNLQEVLSASPDGAKKGTMQFETPIAVARMLAIPLPRRRPIIADLQCGHGALLNATANDSTEHRLGVDIDPTAPGHFRSVIVANVCDLLPLFRDVGVKFPLVVLNPPYGLRWPTTHLPPPPAAGRRVGYSGRRLAEPHLDSTYATWLMAHSLLAPYGEGYLIANASTVELTMANCPLMQHAWWHLTMPNFFPDAPGLERVSVVYFAADHRHGPHRMELPSASLPELEAAVRQAALRRNSWIRGLHMDRTGSINEESGADIRERFAAAKQEWDRRQAALKGEHGEWNIYLRGGRIAIHLTPFQTLSGQVPKTFAEALYRLRGRTPLEMMVMRDTREALEQALHSKIWRVHPALLTALEKAREQFDDVRTPFTRPALAQRVGWLDEQDAIKCLRDWGTFEAGKSYSLNTVTFNGKKVEWREGKEGIEEILVTGQELAIMVNDGTAKHAFTHHVLKSEEPPAELSGTDHFHGLRDLLDHFELPDVPDLAMRQPARYAANLAVLSAIESS